jgi:hypothetical protein
VSGTDGRSVDNVRPDGITLSLKVTFNLLKGSCVDVAKNILSNKVKRSVLLDLSKGPRPHGFAISFGVCSTVALAWVTARDDVAVAFPIKSFDVVKNRDIGPVFSQNGLAEFVLLTEGNCPKSSGSFEAKAESSDAAEQVKDFDFIHRSPSSQSSAQSRRRLGLLPGWQR